jgi:transposase
MAAADPDVAALQARLAAMEAALAASRTALAEREVALAEVAEANRRLELIIDDLRREKFGRSSEKLDPDQRNLPFEDVELAQGVLQAAQDKADATLEASRSRKPSVKRNRNRGALPPHLPRIERVIEPASTLCPCGCGEMAKIGEDVAQRLDIVPAQLRVLVTRRPRYACRRCSGAVAQAHAPEHVVPGGLPTEALIAHVIVSKFGDHLPFYRQADIFRRQGVDLDRATLGNWAGRACFHLKPIVERMQAHLARAERIFMDETRAPVLDPGARKTHIGWFWAIASDDRGHGGTGPPIALFRYAPTRAGAHAERFLDGFRGRLLQCDGYDGYNRLTRIDRAEGGWTLVHCWSHVRRRFVKVMQATASPVAETMLRHIGALYAIEKTVRGRPPEERLKARREHAAPIVAALKPWLEAQLSRISRGSKLAEHIAYTLGCWTGLTRFLEDGRLELDTNPVENLIRPLALTRKNALFAGHEIGAENWALLASLVATCKLNDVEPVAYIAATLRAILDGHPQSRIDELMPWRFASPSIPNA